VIRAFAAALLLAGPAAAAPRFAVEVFAGSAFSFPTPLTIRQEGYPELTVAAAFYDTRPFTGHAPYYAWRLALLDDAGGWELQHLHHKLVLRNRPPEVQLFAVTHGFNIVVVNRAFTVGDITLRAGAGMVIGHPESTVRGWTLDSERGGIVAGYHLSGAALHVSAGRRFVLGAGFSLCVEAALTGAYTEMAVAGGNASVPNVALHWLAGLGWRGL
jgi:hypothetical protein